MTGPGSDVYNLLAVDIFDEIVVIQNLQIDSNEFSKTKIVLTMSATKVDAIVRVFGLIVMPPTIVSAFKDLLLLSIKWRKSLNPCCQRYFLVMRLSFARSGNQPVSAFRL